MLAKIKAPDHSQAELGLSPMCPELGGAAAPYMVRTIITVTSTSSPQSRGAFDFITELSHLCRSKSNHENFERFYFVAKQLIIFLNRSAAVRLIVYCLY